MRIKELILKEAPIPEDWDVDIYSDRVPFKRRVEYAKQRAIQVGKGSSRVAFNIPYQGRKTALKVATNIKGLAQNQAEADLLSDYYLQGIGVVIPLIDYDERNPRPTWIHTEFAEKIKASDFKKFTGGGSYDDLIAYCTEKAGHRRHWMGDASKVNEELDFVNDFYDFYHNYNHVLHFGDFSRGANWGLYNGRPVVIDLGFTHEVYRTHYSR